MVACLSRGKESGTWVTESLGWLTQEKLGFIKVQGSGGMAESPVMSLYHRASGLETSRVSFLAAVGGGFPC